MISVSSTSRELALPFRRNCNTLLHPSAADNRPFFLDGRPSAAHLNCQRRVKIIGIWQRVIRDTLMAVMAARRGSFFSERSSSVCTFYRVLNLPQALLRRDPRPRRLLRPTSMADTTEDAVWKTEGASSSSSFLPLDLPSLCFFFLHFSAQTVFSTALTDVDDALT